MTTPLFDGDSALFEKLAREAQVYGEYGVGASTQWVAAHTDATIRAVDTSREWIIQTLSACGGPDPRFDLNWIDVGPLEDWGFPTTFARREKFPDYFQSIWTGEARPDLVLIDGRFRISCFLTCLLEAKPGTKILFDDYRERTPYHIVEEFIPPADWCGRQALFVVPESLDTRTIRTERDRFAYVWA